MALQSQLFSGDPLLEQIAAGQSDRISPQQNSRDPAVLKEQQALLVWTPECLPVHGADGNCGAETADAVKRFKIEVIGVPEAQVIRDVGPQTVLRLDAIMVEHERPAPTPIVRLRRDIWRLQPEGAPWHDIVLAYALGVGELKKQLATDPVSWHWSYQTQVHGMAADPGDGLRPRRGRRPPDRPHRCRGGGHVGREAADDHHAMGADPDRCWPDGGGVAGVASGVTLRGAAGHFGAPPGIRTQNLWIKSPLLCR